MGLVLKGRRALVSESDHMWALALTSQQNTRVSDQETNGSTRHSSKEPQHSVYTSPIWQPDSRAYRSSITILINLALKLKSRVVRGSRCQRFRPSVSPEPTGLVKTLKLQGSRSSPRPLSSALHRHEAGTWHDGGVGEVAGWVCDLAQLINLLVIES